MRLVYNNKEVILKIIHQGKRRLTFRHAVEMTGIVLDTRTEPGLPQHLYIEVRPLRNALRLQQLVLTFKVFHPLRQFLLNLYTGNIDLLLWYDIVRSRIDHHMLQRGMYLTRQRIRLRDPVYLIPEELNADQMITALCRIDFHHITAHPEAAPVQIHVIAVVLHLDQSPDHIITIPLHTGPQRHTHTRILFRTSQTIDAGHTGHHHHIPPLCQRCRGRKAQLVDFVIDGRILCDIGIGRRHVSLRLVIVVVGDKVFYRIFREKFLELAVQLSSQGLIVRYDQSGLLQLLNDIGHGKGLAGTGHAQQGLKLVALLKTFDQGFYSLRLVTGGSVL